MNQESWMRKAEEKGLENIYAIDRVSKNSVAQRTALKSGLDTLPKRVDELNEELELLSLPISGTQVTYTPDLASVSAATWTTVQTFALTAPVGKKNVSIALVVTPVIRNTGGFTLVRMQIAGNTYPQSTVGQSGICTAGGSFSNVTSVIVNAQVYITTPSSITYSTVANRENCIRTFYMAVWS